MMYELIRYDMWGDEVNDAYRTGIMVNIDDPDTDSDYKINRRLGVRGVTWDGDLQTLYGTWKATGVPACELRRIEQ